MADDLVDNLRQAELSKLPLFHGDRQKDVFTAEQFVVRVQRSKDSSHWTDGQTITFVYNALRGGALTWFEALERSDVNIAVWNNVKTALLEAYSITRTSQHYYSQPCRPSPRINGIGGKFLPQSHQGALRH